MKGEHSEKLKVVKPVLEPMELDEIKKIVSDHYPEAGIPERKLGDGSRPYSASSLFQSCSGQYFLKKRNKAWRSRGDIFWKHSIIEHLCSKGFPTPPLVLNGGGETLTETCDHYYELFHRAEGEDIYHDYHSWMPFIESGHATSAGEALARFHLALEDYDKSGRPRPGTIIEKPMTARFDMAFSPDLPAALACRIAESPVLSAFFDGKRGKADLLPLLLPFQQDMPACRDEIRPWITHGDWHANNLFFRGGRVSSVIDFHLTDLSFRLYDLAVALDRNCIRWLDIQDGRNDAVRFDLIGLFLDGYNSVFPIDEDELKFLSILLPVHQLDLAVSNIEYYFGFEQNRARADWVYDVYLTGHLSFYQKSAGREIIEFIENHNFGRG